MTPYKLILAHSNKFNEEAYQNKLIRSLKIDILNNKIVILINYLKNKIENRK